MSRKGNDLVRRLLYTAAQCAVKWNPAVKTLFARLMAQGKPYNVAIGHCMAKLLRQAFALWKKDCDFDPQFETRNSAEPAGESARESEAEPSPKAEEKQTAAGHKTAVMPQEKVVTATASTIATPARESNLRPLNFAQLREQISITKVLEHIGWQPQSTNGIPWRGPCPLHESVEATSRCFAVQTQQNLYCCHRCQSQGNALDLWTALSGKPLLEAAWELVETFGLTPPLLKEGPPEADEASTLQTALPSWNP
jgi:hypothetical protein